MNPQRIPPEIQAIYPFESRWVRIDGLGMHYVEQGLDQGRPTVLLLHGNPTWSFLYREIIPRISPVCRAVAPDYIGMGLSDKPAHEAFYTLENHTRILGDFVDQLGLKRIVLVVQDWGGPIGFGLALARPGLVAGMLIMNTWAWPDPSHFHASVLPWRMMHAPFAGAHFFLRRNILVERGLYLSTSRAREKLKHGPVLDGYRLPFPTLESRIALLAFPRNIPLKPGDLNWERMKRMEEALPGLSCPCRLLWGEKDNVFPPENAGRFQKLLPACAPPRWIPDGSHFVQEDAPGEIAEEVLKLLDQV
ncbi:MAG: alpha/beta fold hydrolase [Proteobacteria bacterium]|nr:alpha/beta fold hydrolase [Pseudomonadota bacterium]